MSLPELEVNWKDFVSESFGKVTHSLFTFFVKWLVVKTKEFETASHFKLGHVVTVVKLVRYKMLSSIVTWPDRYKEGNDQGAFALFDQHHAFLDFWVH